MDWAALWQQLSEASVYAILLVLGFVLFYFMHKGSVKNIKEISENSIKEIRTAYQDSYDKLMKYIEK